MSASAFIVDFSKIVLLSDGYAYPLTGDHILESTNARKVWKLRSSTGLVWMGSRPNSIDQIVESTFGMDAQRAIHKIAKVLEKGLPPEALALLDDNNPFNIFTFECKPTGTDYFRLFYHIDRFSPTYKGKIPPGTVGCLSVNENPPEFEVLTRKHHQLGKTMEQTAKDAFAEFIELCNDERIGGEIFMETITV